MATAEAPTGISGISERGVVLEGVSWETYEKLVDAMPTRSLFVNYDNGVMEIEMSPRRVHEYDTAILVRLLNAVSLLRGIPVESGGATTHKIPSKKKGFEPDACYWIANEKAMRGVEDLDLTKHPAPDLVIEVDVSASSIDRIEAFRELGVPEVWRVSEDGLEFLENRGPAGFQAVEASLSFPFVKRATVEQAMKASRSIGESAALDQLLSDLGLR